MAMKWQQWAASIPGFVVLDGGLGHTLVERGNRLDVGDMWSGRLLVTNPGEVS